MKKLKIMNIKSTLMKKTSLIILSFIGLCLASNANAQSTINTLEHYDLRPELLSQIDPPNIMIVFDNSGSMDNTLSNINPTPCGFGGVSEELCDAENPFSRSAIARTALAEVLEDFIGLANIGLMVFDAGGGRGGARNFGSLRSSIVPFDQAAFDNFGSILGIEVQPNQNSGAVFDPNTVISDGGTPIAPALGNFIQYVQNSLSEDRNDSGVPISPIPSFQCSPTDTVILFTDGEANAGNNSICAGNQTQCSTEAVQALQVLGWETFVIGLVPEEPTPPGEDGNVTQADIDELSEGLEAIAGGFTEETGEPRQFLAASNGQEIVEALREAFTGVFQRASSGSTAAVSTSSNQDSGFFVQSSYLPTLEGEIHDGTGAPVGPTDENAIQEIASWIGFSRLLFVDPFGFVREDTNDNEIFDATDYNADRAIRIEIADDGTSVFRRLTIDVDPDTGIATENEGAASNQIPLIQLNGLWELNQSLDELYKLNSTDPTIINGEINLTNDEIKFQRNGFTDINRRYIVTNINGNRRDFTYDDGTTGDFGSDPIQASEIGYLGLEAGETEFAKNLIDWVRGADDSEGAGNIVLGDDDLVSENGDSGLRNRTVLTDSQNNGLDFQRFLLGDAIHSAPVVVGAPSEAFFELYGDVSYRDFRDANENRRTVAYIGSNDGMIHAVNTGIFNPIDRSFSENGLPLGFEMWAYIPQSVLPHLRFLASSAYTASNHYYGIDGPIVVKDVNINGTWKTYLFASTGYGGFDHQIDTDVTDVNENFDEILTPSIVILDVTDPENPPIFVAELDDNFGATTVTPAVFHRGGDSFLAVGTGPSSGFSDTAKVADNNAARDEKNGHFSTNEGQVFIYRLDSAGPTLTTTLDGFGDGFIGNIASVDWDLTPDINGNAEFDALYFGLNSGSGEGNDISGKLVRAILDNNNTEDLVTGFSFDNLPLLARDRGQSWVFAGTGRVNSREDFATNEQNKMFGLQESFEANGDIDETPTPGFGEANLVDVTGVGVQVDGDLVNNGGLPAAQDPEDTNTTIDTFLELATEIELFHRGWVRDFANGSPSQRNPGAATTPGANILTFIGFTPEGDEGDFECIIGGQSDLFSTSFSTGTAVFDEALAFLVAEAEAEGEQFFDANGDPVNSDDDIGDEQVISEDGLVPEFTPTGANQNRFAEELKEATGTDTTPSLPEGPVPDEECILGDDVNGICVSSDGTNPACATTLPGQCGFGRKSFREIEFRFFQ